MGLTWTLLLSLTPLTPDKMRVLLALTLLVFVTGALAGGKEKQEMMMWMKMKAMEGCLGQEVVMDHMKKMKISAAKCMKVDTPELELPMFTNTYRFANSLARRPRLGQGSGFKNVMETFMKMQMFSQMMRATIRPGTSSPSAPRTRTFTTSARSCTTSWSSRSTATSALSLPRPCPRACWTTARGVARWSRP